MRRILCVIFGMLVGYSAGLYEDQVGKFEWRQQYIGKPVFSHLDIISPVKKIIIGTGENVLAAVSLKSGDIMWRQIFERGNDGRIVFMHVDNEIATISGSRNPVVRGWELENGHALFEWPVGPVYAQNHAKWMVIDDALVLLQFPHGELTAQWFNLRTGSPLGSKRIAFDVEDASKCIIQGTHVACLESDSVLVVVYVRGLGAIDVKSEKLGDGLKNLKPVLGKVGVVSVDSGDKQLIVKMDPEIQAVNFKPDAGILLSSAATDQEDFLFTSRVVMNTLEVKTYRLDGSEDPTLRGSTPYPADLAAPESVVTVCQQRRDGSVACRLLLTAEDHTLALLQHPGGFLWTRQEALASILGVEIVDLPVSDTDAAIEKEFGDKAASFFGMFLRRLCSQWLQVQNLLLTVLGVPSDTNSNPKELVRDDFGLHKLIVVITKPGKIFGIDNLTGEIVWKLLSKLEPFGEKYGLFVMRTPIHIPHSAQMAILGRDSIGNGALLVLNPITGVLIEPLIKLGYPVLQATMLQFSTENFLKPLLLLDAAGRVHVYPNSAKRVAHSVVPSTFLYTVDPTKGIVDGYALKVVSGEIVATRTWQQKLGQDDARIVSVAAKRDTERVHSQGRVLGDRSVLYKYVNPNLVAIFTQGYHPSHKTILNVFLVDVVSGFVVYSVSHRRAREPIHAVHSENWLVYSYMSDKHRRTEVATLELYEGATQGNATAFTSLASPPLLPLVEKQAYVLPAHVIALKDTVTEKGITNKHIIVALSSGGILELPWAYLDPRRTMIVTQEMREEGVVPYMPELPIPSEAIINHNQSVAEVRGIHTAPSGLESTSLLFVYGLDILYTRVAPSKTFDLLKEDFDYFLISAMMTGLILASLVTRRMASRKALKQAWK